MAGIVAKTTVHCSLDSSNLLTRIPLAPVGCAWFNSWREVEYLHWKCTQAVQGFIPGKMRTPSPTKLARLGHISPSGQVGRPAGPVFFTTSVLCPQIRRPFLCDRTVHLKMYNVQCTLYSVQPLWARRKAGLMWWQEPAILMIIVPWCVCGGGGEWYWY